MTIEFTKDWCLAMARLEAGMEVGAGTTAIDPVFTQEVEAVRHGETSAALADSDGDESRLALGRFVTLMRRRGRLSIEQLANKADIEIGDLLSLEKDAHHIPEVRTIYRLAMVFGVSQKKLMGLSGLTRPKDVRYVGEAVRYAARSESISELTAEEAAALDGLIALLSEKDR